MHLLYDVLLHSFFTFFVLCVLAFAKLNGTPTVIPQVEAFGVRAVIMAFVPVELPNDSSCNPKGWV